VGLTTIVVAPQVSIIAPARYLRCWVLGSSPLPVVACAGFNYEWALFLAVHPPLQACTRVGQYGSRETVFPFCDYQPLQAFLYDLLFRSYGFAPLSPNICAGFEPVRFLQQSTYNALLLVHILLPLSR
jgi:hypothetical protein